MIYSLTVTLKEEKTQKELEEDERDARMFWSYDKQKVYRERIWLQVDLTDEQFQSVKKAVLQAF